MIKQLAHTAPTELEKDLVTVCVPIILYFWTKFKVQFV